MRNPSLLATTLKTLLLASALPALAAAPAAPPAPKGPFAPTWESLKQRPPVPDWFRDAKFGIYFHWGVYSVPAFGNEWYPRNMHFKDNPVYKHHVATYGEPSKFGYHDFIPMFKAERFDAGQWAALFEEAGARFAGPVAEHHDGFSMWASRVNPWNAKDMGPKRDLVGELEKAIRARGMRFVATFHHDRHAQVYQNDPKETKFPRSHYPFIPGMPPTTDDPKLRILYGNFPPEEAYEKYWFGKLKEVIDAYRPDLIWFDSWLDKVPEEYRLKYAAYYFNRAAEWGREVVTTHKQTDMPLEVSVHDIEKGRMGDITEPAWLTDDTISMGSWCYTQDLQIKPTSMVLHSLIDIVSKNGSLLLNISPKADGTIPENQQKVLREMGAWLKKYGEAIYGTRPWVQFGEGPTELAKGRFGGVTDKDGFTPRDLRYTRKGDVLYVIALGWPGAKAELLCTAFASDAVKGKIKVNKVSLLGADQPVRWDLKPEGLALTLPDLDLKDLAVVFKVETTPAAAR